MNKSAHILLVEDNRMDVELTLDAFHEAKLLNTIHVASNGQEALDYLFGRGQYADRSAFPMPNLVLLDLKLPGLDGFEVLRQIKSTPILKRLPVVILTSSKEEGDRARPMTMANRPLLPVHGQISGRSADCGILAVAECGASESEA
jgi:CheY-like chemotaxis protein